MAIKESELVLAPNGSLYHIHLTGDTLADNVLLVGDPDRVNMFKEGVLAGVEDEVAAEESHYTRPEEVIDLATRTVLPNHRRLNLIRIGTSGSLRPEVDCGSLVAARYAIGLDGLLNYYRHNDEGFEKEMEAAFNQHMQLDSRLATPYCVKGSEKLLKQVAEGMHIGITATAPGFYGPQGRDIRLAPSIENLNEKLAAFSWNGTPVTNLEMETSAIYGFSQALGHDALTVCLIIANRPAGTFLNDYHGPMRNTIGTIIERF